MSYKDQAARELHESERRYAITLSSIGDAVIATDNEARVAFMNPVAKDMTGWHGTEAAGKPIDEVFRIINQFSREPVENPVARVLRQGTVVALANHTLLQRRDGRELPVEDCGAPIIDDRGHITGAVLVFHDATERQRAAQELRRTAGLLRAVADGTTDAVFVKDRDGKYLLFNEAAGRFVGKPVAEVLGNDDTALFDAESARRVMDRDRRIMETGEPETGEEELTAAGVTRTYLATKAPYRNERGEVVGIIGISRDISERKHTEEALRRSEAIFRRAQIIAHLASWTFEIDKGIFLGSEEGNRMCGWGRGPHGLAELMGLVHPDDLPRMQAAWTATLLGAPFEIEHRLVVGNQVKWVDVRAEPEFDSDGRIVRITGVTRETTEHRHLEEQLRQSQKMEAIGRLAAGVAHDFNNLLTVIVGHCDVLKRKSSLDARTQDQVGQIFNAGMRAASLTRQLLAFSRKQILAPEVINLNDVVKSIEGILVPLIGEDIRVAAKLDPALSRVEVDPGQIEQVILNLAINSRDAMPRGGQLTIETRNVQWSEELAREFPECSPDQYVLLSVTDTGCGMTPAVKARIFDPFFTTKSPDKGTGLGLAIRR